MVVKVVLEFLEVLKELATSLMFTFVSLSEKLGSFPLTDLLPLPHPVLLVKFFSSLVVNCHSDSILLGQIIFKNI